MKLIWNSLAIIWNVEIKNVELKNVEIKKEEESSDEDVPLSQRKTALQKEKEKNIKREPVKNLLIFFNIKLRFY